MAHQLPGQVMLAVPSQRSLLPLFGQMLGTAAHLFIQRMNWHTRLNQLFLAISTPEPKPTSIASCVLLEADIVPHLALLQLFSPRIEYVRTYICVQF